MCVCVCVCVCVCKAHTTFYDQPNLLQPQHLSCNSSVKYIDISTSTNIPHVPSNCLTKNKVENFIKILFLSLAAGVGQSIWRLFENLFFFILHGLACYYYLLSRRFIIFLCTLLTSFSVFSLGVTWFLTASHVSWHPIPCISPTIPVLSECWNDQHLLSFNYIANFVSN